MGLLQTSHPISVSGTGTITSQDCCKGGDVLRLSAQLYFYSGLLFIVDRDEMDEGTQC